MEGREEAGVEGREEAGVEGGEEAGVVESSLRNPGLFNCILFELSPVWNTCLERSCSGWTDYLQR